MWILLWVALSAFLLGITGWTYMILREQKRAWAAFATAHKLKYDPGKFMSSPTMTGMIGRYSVSFFPGQQPTADSRSQRLVTVVEIDLKCGLPTAAAIGSPDTASFVHALALDFTYEPEAPEGGWSKSYPVRTRDIQKLKAYLTPARVQALHSLFSMKNVAALFFCDEYDTVLRLETADPLRDEKKTEKIINRILVDVEKLMPTDEEQQLTVREREERAAINAEQEAARQAALREAERQAREKDEAALKNAPLQEEKAPK